MYPNFAQVEMLMENNHDEKMDCSFGWHKGPGHQNKSAVEVMVSPTLIPTMVNTGCSQLMIQADLFLSPLGTPESPVSMVCIHGTPYTYELWCIRLTVLGHTEEIAVGLAEILPCPILLGVDWPHLEEVVTQVLTQRGGEWGKDLGCLASGPQMRRREET